MKISSVTLGVSLLTFFIASCVTSEIKEPGPYERNATVSSGKAHEDCFKLAVGQPVDYAFEASGPLDFNLHCHEDGEVMMPVDLKGVSEKSDTFVADRDQYWCLMWENKSTGKVKLSYEFTIGDK